MRCSNCGYNSLKDFTVCPYCDKPRDIASNSESEYVSINPTANNPDIYNNPNMNPPLPTSPQKIPKGYFKTANGFSMKQIVKDGEFYQTYLLFNLFVTIISVLVFIVLFIFKDKYFAVEGDIVHGIILSFICSSVVFMLLYLFLSWIYNIIVNSVTFTMDQNGLYVKSVMKEYFINKENLRTFKFEFITRHLDRTKLFRDTGCRRRYDPVTRTTRTYVDPEAVERLVLQRQGYNIFFTVAEPIFVNDKFASDDKKYLHHINTGLSFNSSLEAKFLVEEFERLLR